MSNKKQSKSYRNIGIIAGIAVLLAVGLFFYKTASGTEKQAAALQEDLVISKSEISDTVKFYPVKVGNKNMELLAVKASDGTIRTAFNTCQVCNGSPMAYYKQDGNSLVCQNCGNRFSMDMVEQQRGGCNPIPILEENKVEDGTTIVISKEFIEQNKDLFTDNWKTK